MEKTLKSYFFWTHSRGSFHYDVMVTLILAFIFITPHLVNYGDKPSPNPAVGPITVNADGDHGLILTVPYAEARIDLTASDRKVRKALHQAIEPVTGDAVTVVRWETVPDSAGRPLAWKIWVHR